MEGLSASLKGTTGHDFRGSRPAPEDPLCVWDVKNEDRAPSTVGHGCTLLVSLRQVPGSLSDLWMQRRQRVWVLFPRGGSAAVTPPTQHQEQGDERGFSTRK